MFCHPIFLSKKVDLSLLWILFDFFHSHILSVTIVIDIYWVHPSLVLPSTSIELGSYHIPIHLYRIIIRRKGFYSIDDTVRNNNNRDED